MSTSDDPAGQTAFSDADLRQLEEVGIDEAEARRQLAMLRSPERSIVLERACTLGDGIVALTEDDRDELLKLAAGALDRLHVTKFVPASGAASRMFRDLHGDPEARNRFTAELPRFPFYSALDRAVSTAGEDLKELVAAKDDAKLVHYLLTDEGLGYESLAKGLIPFHRGPGAGRTAVEEQLREAIALFAPQPASVHLTVAPEQRDGFARSLEELTPALRDELSAPIQVELSEQSPATATIALDPQDRPAHRANGRLILRPGGHGALIRNLDRLRCDLVWIKNVDNVLPAPRQAPCVQSARLLLGHLVRLQEKLWTLLDELRTASTPSRRALAEAHRRIAALGHPAPAPVHQAASDRQRQWLLQHLDRPLRVCGVVPNTGEPGGGPFWVRCADGGLSAQIVEGAQIDHQNPGQAKIARSSTHFNPTDLVCSLRNAAGQPFELEDLVDPGTSIVTDKSEAGQRLRVLERPGLWNGAMAGWNTAFVEIPAEVFNPVKTVFDLLRPEHQG